MKTSSRLVTVISLISLCFLVVATPVTARMVSNKIIQSGDTIFQWEQGLDLSQMNTSWRVDRLTYYADITDGETFSFIVSDPTSFDVEDRAGKYISRPFYLYNFTVGRLPELVFIDNVKIFIDILLDKYHEESVNGLSIPRDTMLAVKISSNIAAAHLVPDLSDNNFALQVEFTSPEGVPFTIFGGQDFSRVMLDWTGKSIIIGGINPAAEEIGQWSVQAKWLPDTDFAQAQADADSNIGFFNTSRQKVVSISATTTFPRTELTETVLTTYVSQTATPVPTTLKDITTQMTIPPTDTGTTVQTTMSPRASGFEIWIAVVGMIFVAYFISKQ